MAISELPRVRGSAGFQQSPFDGVAVMSVRLAAAGWGWLALTFALPLGMGLSAQEKSAEEGQAERLARSPRQVAEQLAIVYGKKLDQVAYIPALPLIAKLRLSETTGEA